MQDDANRERRERREIKPSMRAGEKQVAAKNVEPRIFLPTKKARDDTKMPSSCVGLESSIHPDRFLSCHFVPFCG